MNFCPPPLDFWKVHTSYLYKYHHLYFWKLTSHIFLMQPCNYCWTIQYNGTHLVHYFVNRDICGALDLCISGFKTIPGKVHVRIVILIHLDFQIMHIELCKYSTYSSSTYSRCRKTFYKIFSEGSFNHCSIKSEGNFPLCN